MMRAGAILLLVLLATAASAQPSASARQASAQVLLDQGVAAFSRGDFRRSKQLLRRAEKTAQAPALLAKIHLYLGLDAAALGETDAAHEAFRRALTHDPKLTLDGRRHNPGVMRLFDKARDATLGSLHVTVDDANARIVLDGVEVGQGPYRALLPTGSHLLEVKSPDGRQLYRQLVSVSAGRVLRVEVVVTPVSRPTSVPSSAGSPAAPAGSSRRSRLWTWIAAGGAVISAGLAVGLVAAANGDEKDACALLSGEGDCASRASLSNPADLPRYEDLYEGARDKRSWAVGLGIASGALVVAATVLFFIEGGSGEAPTLTASAEGLRLGFHY